MNKAYTLDRLFCEFPGGICVPRIQRGYVQGRNDTKGMEIRANFVPALVNATFNGEGLSLDFVYGIASGDGGAGRRLLPLDGQQRLSTLFLLAWLCGKWKNEWRFDYEARRIPQIFVEGLRQHPFGGVMEPSQEIRDSAWFLPVWANDPTVAGMLRVLDALHKTIGQRNRANADFGRVTFLLHGIEGQSDTFDHIFRKMNARGKELSPWENMKVMLDKILDKHLPDSLASEWREKIDGEWPERIWNNVNGDIAKLDGAMEKIVRMAYALSARSLVQDDSLWHMEARLCGTVSDCVKEVFSPETCEAFYRMAALFFNELETIATRWTGDRTFNSLWGDGADSATFWIWLTNGCNASYADLLRMFFLTKASDLADIERRRRVLLNLLDCGANLVNQTNWSATLKAGLSFLTNSYLDPSCFHNDKTAFPDWQIQDEENKWKLPEADMIRIETDELVYRGRLGFIGWSPFTSVSDVENRLTEVRNEIENRERVFFFNLLSRFATQPGEIALPHAGDKKRWKEFLLPHRMMVEALALWHHDKLGPSTEQSWVLCLEELEEPLLSTFEKARIGSNFGGRLFLVTGQQNRNWGISIRLDLDIVERENRKLLASPTIIWGGEYPYVPSRESMVWYNVEDPSWNTTTPKKWTRDENGEWVEIGSR